MIIFARFVKFILFLVFVLIANYFAFNYFLEKQVAIAIEKKKLEDLNKGAKPKYLKPYPYPDDDDQDIVEVIECIESTKESLNNAKLSAKSTVNSIKNIFNKDRK